MLSLKRRKTRTLEVRKNKATGPATSTGCYGSRIAKSNIRTYDPSCMLPDGTVIGLPYERTKVVTCVTLCKSIGKS